jgi:outer membrane biosynthesis protein TonB
MRKTVVAVSWITFLIVGCSSAPPPPPVTQATPASPSPTPTVSPSTPVPVAPASPEASPAPTSSPDPEPPVAKTKEVENQVIQFQPGKTETSVQGKVTSKGIDRFTFEATAGQPGKISITSPNQDVLLTLIDPQGSPIQRYQSGSATWDGTLPTSGTYTVDVFGGGQDSSYTLTVSILPKP